jgi:aspartate racemase
MIESAVNGIKAHFKHGAKVAILATDGTIQRGLYQESLTNAGFVPYLPSPKCQEAVMHLIYDCVKAGQAVDTDAIQLIEQELAAQECAVPILGCPELSVIVDYFDGYCVDPMLALARAVINFEGRQFH